MKDEQEMTPRERRWQHVILKAQRSADAERHKARSDASVGRRSGYSMSAKRFIICDPWRAQRSDAHGWIYKVVSLAEYERLRPVSAQRRRERIEREHAQKRAQLPVLSIREEWNGEQP